VDPLRRTRLSPKGLEGDDAPELDHEPRRFLLSRPGRRASGAVLTLRGLALEQGVNYFTVETLYIWLAAGSNTFTIDGTHGGSTTVSTAEGQDTVNINGSSGLLTVNAEEDNDIVNVRAIGGATTVNAGAGDDTVNVGNLAGTVDDIGAVLTVNGDAGTNVLNVDDTGDSSANAGLLTATTITELDMAGSITYGTIETLNIGLGSNADTFTVVSTHARVTNLNANNGADIVNVRTISGITTVNGGNGSDTFNVGNLSGTVDGIGALLTINGNDPTSGSDALNVDDTGDTDPNTGFLTSTTITGLDMAGSISYATIEHLTISLGSGADTFTINSTHGAATSTLEDTTLNAGAGTDTVHINDVTDLLFVNGQADADTINVNGTGAGSVSTVHGDAGNDTVNVRAMNGAVNVYGDADSDTVNVTDLAPLLPAGPRTTPTGSIDAINALLAVDGGGGLLDVLNVDDSRAAASNHKTGTLTATTLRGLELEVGIDYLALEKLNLWLGFGNNVFDINGTHATETTVHTAQGTDTVNINDARGLLTVNAEQDDDTINVRGTSLGSEARINGQEGADTFNLTAAGTIDAIDGLIVLNGGAESDIVNVDDAANTANKAGTLTSGTLCGLEMPAGVDYSQVEDFNLWLGTGTDGLFILALVASLSGAG